MKCVCCDVLRMSVAGAQVQKRSVKMEHETSMSLAYDGRCTADESTEARERGSLGDSYADHYGEYLTAKREDEKKDLLPRFSIQI